MWQMNSEALQAVDQIIQQLQSAGAEPSKVAFAYYIKMQVLSWMRSYEEAITLAQEIDVAYRDTTDPVVERIRVAVLLRAAGYHAKIGQAAEGHALLDSIKADHPEGTFDSTINSFREVVEEHEHLSAAN
jgi:hypothetical protein